MNISLLYNFFMGETSPLIAARIDSPAHQMGAQRMENFIPMLTGGLRKRPGTWFDGNLYQNKETRLIEWLLSDGTCLLILLTDTMLQVYREDTDKLFRPIPTTPQHAIDYVGINISEIQYAASANTIWFVHTLRKPIKIEWNNKEKKILLTTPIFTKNISVIIQVDVNCVFCDGIGEFTEGETCTYCNGAKRVNVETNCLECNGTGRIQVNSNPAARTASDYVICSKCNGTGLITNKINCTICDGTGLINNTSDCQNCSGTGKVTIDDIKINQEQIFNKSGEYPGCIAFHAGRLCLGGTLNEPNRLYMSKAPNSITGTYNYEDFSPGSNPADSIVIEKNDMHGSRIQWIAANRFFLAATEKATWSDDGAVPTPSTFNLNIVEYSGSNELQPKGTKEIMVYAGRGGKSLRALVWNQGTQGSGFIDIDISEQSAHLFMSGIKELAVSDYPFPTLWIVTNNGDLLSCTINISGGVIAFTKHNTDGIIESVAVAPQKTGDIIFIIVNRGSVQNPIRNLEHLIITDLVNEDFSDSHYVDAGERITFTTPTNTITGLQRFAGKKINIFADGAIEPPLIVDEDGTIELQRKVSKVHLGLPFISLFRPNERQIPADGTSLGKKRRLEKITLRLFRSLGGRAGTTENKTTDIITQRYGSYVLDTAPEPFTGEYEITISGNIDTEGKLVIIHEEPVPFTILALVERVAILEG